MFSFMESKRIKSIFIALAGILLGSYCTPKSNSDTTKNLIFLLAAAGTPGGTSVVTISRTDLSNFEGTCLDGFAGVTANQYFSTNQLNSRNTTLERNRISTSSCSLQGFRSFGPRQDNGLFQYNVWKCGALVNQPCSNSVVQGMGF